MRAPTLLCPGPSFAELFSRSAFSQNPLLDGRKLANAAEARGIALPRFPRKTLERLDRIGAFCPLAFSQANYDVETTWLDPDPDYMIWREERNFERWQTHAWVAHSGTPYVSEKFSSWQLLYLADAFELADVTVPAEVLAGSGDMAAYVGAAADRQAAQRELDESWRPALKLLVALQTRLWPFRRGKTTLLNDPGHEQQDDGPVEYVDPVEVEAERFDPHRVLEQFEVTLDGLAELHREFAYAARSLDPMPAWYRLQEMAPRRETDLLRGNALRARDLYDACYLLRGLYHLATARWLPRPDEMEDTTVSFPQAHLPREDVEFGCTHDELQSALERAGLYPHRIHFVVEGETEDIVLRRLLHALSRTTGYQITNFRGVDKDRQHEALFAAASEYASKTVLIADGEGNLSKALTRLRRDGLLTHDSDVLLWEVDGHPSSFEEANFRAEEILDAMTTAAQKRRPDIDLDLTGEQLRALYGEAVEKAAVEDRDRPAFAKFALARAEDRHVRVSKVELAEELADITLGVVDVAGSLYEAGKDDQRPLLGRLWQWLREVR